MTFMTFLEVKKVTIETVDFSYFTADNVRDFMEWLLTKKNNSAKTVNLRLSQLQSFMKFVAQKQPQYRAYYVEMTYIKQYKVTETKKANMALTRNAIKAIIESPGTKTKTGVRYTALFSFQYFTMTRIDEVLSIKIKDLQLDCERPCVPVIGKGRKKRFVAIPRQAIKPLKVFIQKAHGLDPNPDAFLFYSTTKGLFEKSSERSVNKQLKVYARKARMSCDEVPEHVHSHQFRHAGATHRYEDGLNIFQISKILGHESVETTQIYLGVTLSMMNDNLHKAESITAGMMKPSWKQDKKPLRDYFKT